MNNRTAKANQMVIEVFHLQQENGEPWDIGVQHYVEIPPAGIFDVMEISQVTYVVESDKTLKTEITLVPAPVKEAPTDEFLGEVPEVSDTQSTANGRKSRSGAEVPKETWCAPTLVFEGNSPVIPSGEKLGFMSEVENASTVPPATLPPSYGSGRPQ
jgi:hypothetical protein